MDIVLSKGVWINFKPRLRRQRRRLENDTKKLLPGSDLFPHDLTCSWTNPEDRGISVKFGEKSVPTSDRAWAEKSHQSSTKKLICFYGRTVSLPPRSHLVALSSGRGGDTPPVGRQDALLKATGGRSGLKAHRHRVCSFPQRGDCLWAQTRAPIL